MQALLEAQGVTSLLRLARDHPHVWPLFHNILPEAKATLADLGAWIRAL
jgi:hypothetical protein